MTETGKQHVVEEGQQALIDKSAEQASFSYHNCISPIPTHEYRLYPALPLENCAREGLYVRSIGVRHKIRP